MSANKREKHCVAECQECLNTPKLKLALSAFPNKSKKYELKAKLSGLFHERQITNATSSALRKLDTEFQQNFGTTFTTQMKQQFGTKAKDKQQLARNVLNNVKIQQDKTALIR